MSRYMISAKDQVLGIIPGARAYNEYGRWVIRRPDGSAIGYGGDYSPRGAWQSAIQELTR